MFMVKMQDIPEIVIYNFDRYCGRYDFAVSPIQYDNNMTEILKQYNAIQNMDTIFFESDEYYTWFLMRFS